MARATDMNAREPEFLWGGRIPVGHMTVIAGQPRMGKSTLGYRIAADCDVPTLFVTTEEVDETVWLPRILAAGVDREKAFYHPEVEFTRHRSDLDHLMGLVREYGIKLIIVDPVQNHLGASISHDQSVRALMHPYIEALGAAKVALVLEAHVLRGIKANSDPQTAIPSGLRSWMKAAYLFGKDPTQGVGPDFSVLACATFGFGVNPASTRFEFDTTGIEVIRKSGRGRITIEYGVWIDRGAVPVSAKTLVVSLTPESNEKIRDRLAFQLIRFLHEAGGKQSVTAVKKWRLTLDPPVSWRLIEKVAKDLDIERTEDPSNKAKRFWSLPDDLLDVAEVAESEADIEITEVDSVPDTIPEDWEDKKDEEEGA